MRPVVQELLTRKAWQEIRQLEGDIITDADPREMRVLGLAFLYSGSVWRALYYLRLCVSQLEGRERSAAMVDIACSLSLMGDYREAQEWLTQWNELPEQHYRGPALECQAYCSWRLRLPWWVVDAEYSAAIEAFGGNDYRIARITIDRLQALIEHGQIALAESLFEAVSGRSDLAGHVLGIRSRLAAAHGDRDQAVALAMDAIGVLHSTVDPLGNNLREVGRLYLLLGQISSPPESLTFTAAAKAVAVTLRNSAMYDEALLIETKGGN